VSFLFQPAKRPFKRWMGPFSPARGTYSGFRFHDGRLGTWVEDDDIRGFWSIADGTGVRALQKLVIDEWGGGRVLFLPNGYLVKPLQKDNERGQRAFIGRFEGRVVLERPDGARFDLSAPGTKAGRRWPGPQTTGLECYVGGEGVPTCTWYHPTEYGRDELEHPLAPRIPGLAAGFRACRPADTSGRIRITANGHVITNRQDGDGSWTTLYVGWINPASWDDWSQWIVEG
jgi:hypothetical protein